MHNNARISCLNYIGKCCIVILIETDGSLSQNNRKARRTENGLMNTIEGKGIGLIRPD